MKSKKIYKSITAIIVFVFLFVAMFSFVSEILCRKTVGGAWNYTEKIAGFYNSQNNEYDVMFFGSSNTYCSFNPLIFYEESGVKSYILATQNQPVWASYTYMKESLKTQNPKLLVMDILAFTYKDEYSDDGVTHSYMDDLPMSANKLELARVSAPDLGKRFELLCNFVKYHSRWNELTKTDFTFKRSKARDYLKGYVLLESTFDKAILPDADTEGTSPIEEKQKQYFYKIINLAKENNIPLLLVKTPSNVLEKDQKLYNTVKKMAKEEGVPFVDFNRRYDKIGLDIKDDFFDKSHLNYKGAEKFTRYFAEVIAKEYPNVKSKDTNNTTSMWENDIREYRKYIKSINKN